MVDRNAELPRQRAVNIPPEEYTDFIKDLVKGIRLYNGKGSLEIKLTIPEEEITQFCQRCDLLDENGICQRNPVEQAISVITGSCYWALVQGIGGGMLKRGFQPFKSINIR